MEDECQTQWKKVERERERESSRLSDTLHKTGPDSQTLDVVNSLRLRSIRRALICVRYFFSC